MKTTIYFVRHAQSDLSIKDDLTRPLTTEGEKAAKQLTNILSNQAIDAIFSSPCIRSIDTVKPFAKQKKLPITIKNDFAERRVGTWVDDFQSFSSTQWADFHYKLEQGESLFETQARNIAALQKIVKTHPNQAVIIATHGTALSTIVNYYDSTCTYDYFLSIKDKMPYVLRFTFEDGIFQEMKEISLHVAY
ncbi:MAG: histidine phosphatase family protein [Bacillaceae bacterium]